MDLHGRRYVSTLASLGENIQKALHTHTHTTNRTPSAEIAQYQHRLEEIEARSKRNKTIWSIANVPPGVLQSSSLPPFLSSSSGYWRVIAQTVHQILTVPIECTRDFSVCVAAIWQKQTREQFKDQQVYFDEQNFYSVHWRWLRLRSPARICYEG